ncbi:MAG: amidohydrolase [Phycisphaerales bacterium]|nr:amidohydrolase [Phycisphaerales bacterium]
MIEGSIDAHLHVWDPARGDYGWLAQAPLTLQRAYLMQEAVEALDACDVQRAILVQAAPTIAETEYLLSLASRDKRVAGVVGWLPLTGAYATAGELAALRGCAGGAVLVAIRPMLQDISDDGYLLRDEVIASIEVLATDARPLALDALVLPKHLDVLESFLRRAEQFARPLNVIVDHIAKPAVREGNGWRGLCAWRSQLRAIAQFPNASCKLSGLPAEAEADATAETFRPYIETALELFGAERLLWGSDWPIVALSTPMRNWRDAVSGCLSSLSSTERDAIFGANASRIYQLAPAQLG